MPNLRSFTLTSGGSSEEDWFVSGAFVLSLPADASSADGLLSPAFSSEPADSKRGVADLLEPSSSPMANSGSNSLGSGPRTGVPVFRRGRVVRLLGDALRVGRRAELERASESWADFCRACSSAIRESIASRIRCGLRLGRALTYQIRGICSTREANPRRSSINNWIRKYCT